MKKRNKKNQDNRACEFIKTIENKLKSIDKKTLAGFHSNVV